MNFFNNKNFNLEDIAKSNQSEYTNGDPFPHIVFDNFFNNEILEKIITEFPNNLEKIGKVYNNKVEKKLSLNKSELLSSETNNFLNFLNSQIFINFLQSITSIKEKLIPDPYLLGGGLHELRIGGYLNIHSDFNKHPSMKLDRRLNVLIYLNKNWNSTYGGSLELWDKKMEKCKKKILPIFNRMVIFSTNDFSYHGNPEKVNCPDNESRKSIARYYYTNGRPLHEIALGNHSTIFRKRPKIDEPDGEIKFKKLFGQLYLRKKNKIK